MIARTTIRRHDGEYHVRAYDQLGKRMPDSDYFTDDQQDAHQTAAAMIQLSTWQVWVEDIWMNTPAYLAACWSATGSKIRLI